MAIESKTQLKTYFQTGDVPTQGQFANLIDSFAQASATGGIEQPWNAVLPTQQYVDLLSVPSIAGNAGFEDHDRFRFWLELHDNPDPGIGADYSFAWGLTGNGTTTNIALFTQETNWDPGANYRSNEFYVTYQHVNSAWWPTARRCFWCVSTFSNNQGNIANPLTIGFATLDQIQFTALQPSVAGSIAGWRYCQLKPNFQSGGMLMELTSAPSNFGQALFSVSSTGLAINITGNHQVVVSGTSYALSWSGGGIAVNGTNKTYTLIGAWLGIDSGTTGGVASGLTIFHHGLYYNYQAIELRPKSAGNVVGIGFWNATVTTWSIQSRTDASDRFAIYNRALDVDALRINFTTNEVSLPSNKLTLAAATTARSSLNIPSGTAPTTPNNGDIWFNGTDFKCQVGGVTKTFTIV